MKFILTRRGNNVLKFGALNIGFLKSSHQKHFGHGVSTYSLSTETKILYILLIPLFQPPAISHSAPVRKSSVLRAASALGIVSDKPQPIVYSPKRAWISQPTTVRPLYFGVPWHRIGQRLASMRVN